MKRFGHARDYFNLKFLQSRNTNFAAIDAYVLGNFLTYRQLDRKTLATQPPTRITVGHAQPSNSSHGHVVELEDEQPPLRKRVQSSVGTELLSSVHEFSNATTTGGPVPFGPSKKFTFREGGLIKKTISVTIQGHIHHLICYYSKQDFFSGTLQDSLEASIKAATELQAVPIGEDLLGNQSFRKAGADEIYKRSSLLEDEDEFELMHQAAA